MLLVTHDHAIACSASTHCQGGDGINTASKLILLKKVPNAAMSDVQQ